MLDANCRPPLTRRQLRLEREAQRDLLSTNTAQLTRKAVREMAQAEMATPFAPMTPIGPTALPPGSSTPPPFGVSIRSALATAAAPAGPPAVASIQWRAASRQTDPLQPQLSLAQGAMAQAKDNLVGPKETGEPASATSLASPKKTGEPASANSLASPLTREELRRTSQPGAVSTTPGLRTFTRQKTKPIAAAAATVLVVGGGLVGGAFDGPPKEPSLDALSPLRTTVELVSRRNVAQAPSRSMTARLQSQGVDARMSQANATNATLVLELNLPKLGPDETISIRRSAGLQPPATPAEGVEVAINGSDGVVVDEGLSPDTNYAYTVFLHREGAKPEIVATTVGSTTLYPTELAPGDSLVAGERLVSPDNSYFFTVSQEGQAALYNDRNQKIWTFDVGAADQAEVVMQTNGELVVTSNGQAVWTSHTSVGGASLSLTDNGVLLIQQNGTIFWSSTANGDQLHGGDSPYVISSDGWTQPAAGPFRSPFGGRMHPIAGVYKQHEGIDLKGGGRGQPIYAAADGVVETIRCDSGGNWTLVIDHGDGITTRYLHWDGMENVLVKEGQRVVAGQHVANVGNSGYSTGPHLHFEVRIDDQATDPVAFLKDHGVQPNW